MIAIAMTTMDISIVNITLPTIEKDLYAGEAQLQWVSVAYTLSFALTLVTAGRIGDMAGRKRMQLAGVGGFVVAFAVWALAPTIGVLLAGRVLQGLTGAFVTTLALSIFQVSFPPRERPKVFGMFGAVGGISAALGPPLGGLLVHADLFGLTWRPVFLVNLPIGLVAFIGVALYVRESRSERPLRLDFAGVVLLTLTQLALVYPLIQGREQGWPWWTVVLLMAGVPLLVVFVLSQRAQTRAGGNPLVPSELFRHRDFAVGLPVALTFFGAAFSPFFMLAIYLQNGLGWSALDAGLTALASPAGIAVASGATSSLAGRAGPRLLTEGTAVGLAGQLFLIWTIGRAEADAGIPQFIAPIVLMGLGTGIVMAPVIDIILARVPPAVSGSASGLLNTSHQLGVMIGVAVAGTVFFARATDSMQSGESRADAFGSGMVMALTVTAVMLGIGLILTTFLSRRTEAAPEQQTVGADGAGVP